MTRNRLEAFSDGVIAIIITIMVLNLKEPKDATCKSFIEIMPGFLSYGLSFLMAAVYWVNHHHLLHLAQRVDGAILWANMNLLFWMSLMPWATDGLATTRAAPFMVQLYVALALAGAISFFFLRHSISRQHSDNRNLMELHGKLARKNLLAVGIYSISLAAAFFSTVAAMTLVVLPTIMYFIPDRSVENLMRE